MLAFTTKFKKGKEKKEKFQTLEQLNVGDRVHGILCIRSLKKPNKSLYLGNACKRREKKEYENYSTISMIGLFEEVSNLKYIFVFTNLLYQK